MALDRNFSIAATDQQKHEGSVPWTWPQTEAEPVDPGVPEPLPPNAFREFANWRLRSIADRPLKSIRFFRSSLNHTAVWMLVMRGYYDGNPPTVGQCQDICTCSRLTARKLISHALSLDYLELRSDPGDQRKRTVSPTDQTVLEYAGMVRRYLSMCNVLRLDYPALAPEARQDA